MAINDVTYLLDESLQLLKKIHQIETEMDNKEAWEATPMVLTEFIQFHHEILGFLGNTYE